jgi:hypothetical protein
MKIIVTEARKDIDRSTGSIIKSCKDIGSFSVSRSGLGAARKLRRAKTFGDTNTIAPRARGFIWLELDNGRRIEVDYPDTTSLADLREMAGL